MKNDRNHSENEFIENLRLRCDPFSFRKEYGNQMG